MKFIMRVMEERLECANKKQETDFDLLPIMFIEMYYYALMCVGIVSMEKQIWKKSS